MVRCYVSLRIDEFSKCRINVLEMKTARKFMPAGLLLCTLYIISAGPLQFVSSSSVSSAPLTTPAFRRTSQVENSHEQFTTVIHHKLDNNRYDCRFHSMNRRPLNEHKRDKNQLNNFVNHEHTVPHTPQTCEKEIDKNPNSDFKFMNDVSKRTESLNERVNHLIPEFTEATSDVKCQETVEHIAHDLMKSHVKDNKQISSATVSPVTACLAGYDEQIYTIMDEIRRNAKGTEVVVHFYYFQSCKFHYMGTVNADLMTIQDILKKYPHYFCLDHKFVQNYEENDCWCVDKWIMIPSMDKRYKQKESKVTNSVNNVFKANNLFKSRGGFSVNTETSRSILGNGLLSTTVSPIDNLLDDKVKNKGFINNANQMLVKVPASIASQNSKGINSMVSYNNVKNVPANYGSVSYNIDHRNDFSFTMLGNYMTPKAYILPYTYDYRNIYSNNQKYVPYNGNSLPCSTVNGGYNWNEEFYKFNNYANNFALAYSPFVNNNQNLKQNPGYYVFDASQKGQNQITCFNEPKSLYTVPSTNIPIYNSLVTNSANYLQSATPYNSQPCYPKTYHPCKFWTNAASGFRSNVALPYIPENRYDPAAFSYNLTPRELPYESNPTTEIVPDQPGTLLTDTASLILNCMAADKTDQNVLQNSAQTPSSFHVALPKYNFDNKVENNNNVCPSFIPNENAKVSNTDRNNINIPREYSNIGTSNVCKQFGSTPNYCANWYVPKLPNIRQPKAYFLNLNTDYSNMKKPCFASLGTSNAKQFGVPWRNDFYPNGYKNTGVMATPFNIGYNNLFATNNNENGRTLAGSLDQGNIENSYGSLYAPVNSENQISDFSLTYHDNTPVAQNNIESYDINGLKPVNTKQQLNKVASLNYGQWPKIQKNIPHGHINYFNTLGTNVNSNIAGFVKPFGVSYNNKFTPNVKINARVNIMDKNNEVRPFSIGYKDTFAKKYNLNTQTPPRSFNQYNVPKSLNEPCYNANNFYGDTKSVIPDYAENQDNNNFDSDYNIQWPNAKINKPIVSYSDTASSNADVTTISHVNPLVNSVQNGDVNTRYPANMMYKNNYATKPFHIGYNGAFKDISIESVGNGNTYSLDDSRLNFKDNANDVVQVNAENKITNKYPKNFAIEYQNNKPLNKASYLDTTGQNTNSKLVTYLTPYDKTHFDRFVPNANTETAVNLMNKYNIQRPFNICYKNANSNAASYAKPFDISYTDSYTPNYNSYTDNAGDIKNKYTPFSVNAYGNNYNPNMIMYQNNYDTSFGKSYLDTFTTDPKQNTVSVNTENPIDDFTPNYHAKLYGSENNQVDQAIYLEPAVASSKYNAPQAYSLEPKPITKSYNVKENTVLDRAGTYKVCPVNKVQTMPEVYTHFNKDTYKNSLIGPKYDTEGSNKPPLPACVLQLGTSANQNFDTKIAATNTGYNIKTDDPNQNMAAYNGIQNTLKPFELSYSNPVMPQQSNFKFKDSSMAYNFKPFNQIQNYGAGNIKKPFDVSFFNDFSNKIVPNAYTNQNFYNKVPSNYGYYSNPTATNAVQNTNSICNMGYTSNTDHKDTPPTNEDTFVSKPGEVDKFDHKEQNFGFIKPDYDTLAPNDINSDVTDSNHNAIVNSGSYKVPCYDTSARNIPTKTILPKKNKLMNAAVFRVPNYVKPVTSLPSASSIFPVQNNNVESFNLSYSENYYPNKGIPNGYESSSNKPFEISYHDNYMPNTRTYPDNTRYPTNYPYNYLSRYPTSYPPYNDLNYQGRYPTSYATSAPTNHPPSYFTNNPTAYSTGYPTSYTPCNPTSYTISTSDPTGYTTANPFTTPTTSYVTNYPTKYPRYPSESYKYPTYNFISNPSGYPNNIHNSYPSSDAVTSSSTTLYPTSGSTNYNPCSDFTNVPASDGTSSISSSPTSYASSGYSSYPSSLDTSYSSSDDTGYSSSEDSSNLASSSPSYPAHYPTTNSYSYPTSDATNYPTSFQPRYPANNGKSTFPSRMPFSDKIKVTVNKAFNSTYNAPAINPNKFITNPNPDRTYFNKAALFKKYYNQPVLPISNSGPYLAVAPSIKPNTIIPICKLKLNNFGKKTNLPISFKKNRRLNNNFNNCYNPFIISNPVTPIANDANNNYTPAAPTTNYNANQFPSNTIQPVCNGDVSDMTPDNFAPENKVYKNQINKPYYAPYSNAFVKTSDKDLLLKSYNPINYDNPVGKFDDTNNFKPTNIKSPSDKPNTVFPVRFINNNIKQVESNDVGSVISPVSTVHRTDAQTFNSNFDALGSNVNPQFTEPVGLNQNNVVKAFDLPYSDKYYYNNMNSNGNEMNTMTLVNNQHGLVNFNSKPSYLNGQNVVKSFDLPYTDTYFPNMNNWAPHAPLPVGLTNKISSNIAKPFETSYLTKLTPHNIESVKDTQGNSLSRSSELENNFHRPCDDANTHIPKDFESVNDGVSNSLTKPDYSKAISLNSPFMMKLDRDDNSGWNKNWNLPETSKNLGQLINNNILQDSAKSVPNYSQYDVKPSDNKYPAYDTAASQICKPDFPNNPPEPNNKYFIVDLPSNTIKNYASQVNQNKNVANYRIPSYTSYDRPSMKEYYNLTPYQSNEKSSIDYPSNYANKDQNYDKINYNYPFNGLRRQTIPRYYNNFGSNDFKPTRNFVNDINTGIPPTECTTKDTLTNANKNDKTEVTDGSNKKIYKSGITCYKYPDLNTQPNINNAYTDEVKKELNNHVPYRPEITYNKDTNSHQSSNNVYNKQGPYLKSPHLYKPQITYYKYPNSNMGPNHAYNEYNDVTKQDSYETPSNPYLNNSPSSVVLQNKPDNIPCTFNNNINEVTAKDRTQLKPVDNSEFTTNSITNDAYSKMPGSQYFIQNSYLNNNYLNNKYCFNPPSSYKPSTNSFSYPQILYKPSSISLSYPQSLDKPTNTNNFKPGINSYPYPQNLYKPGLNSNSYPQNLNQPGIIDNSDVKSQNANNIKSEALTFGSKPINSPTYRKPSNNNAPEDTKNIRDSIKDYINSRDDVKNDLFNSKEITIPLGDLGVAKYCPNVDDPYSFTLPTSDPNIVIKGWNTTLKIAEIKVVLKTDEVDAMNFIPVVKNDMQYDPNTVQDVVTRVVKNLYGEPIVIKGVYSANKPYAMVYDEDKIKLDDSKFFIVWPTYCNCGAVKPGYTCGWNNVESTCY